MNRALMMNDDIMYRDFSPSKIQGGKDLIHDDHQCLMNADVQER